MTAPEAKKHSKSVLIVTEGGKKTGWGHLVRCSALYHAFGEKHFVPEMIVNGDATCANILKGLRYQMFNWLKDQQKLYGLVQKARVVIIDSYLAPKSIYDHVSRLVSGRSIMLDDTNRLIYPAGIVVNPSIFGDTLNYSKRRETDYLLGQDYIILRKPFWNVHLKAPRKKVKNVFIALGGTRESEALVNRIRDFLAANFPSYAYQVVVPGANLSALQMRRLMLKCDLGISAGGQTLYELISAGVPVMTICLAKNQKFAIDFLLKKGLIKYAGWQHERKFWEKFSQTFQGLLPFETRQKMFTNGQGAIEGRGAQRVIKCFLAKMED